MRILMNAADTSPGNGAPAAPPAAPPSDDPPKPQAQVAPPPQAPDDTLQKLAATVADLAKSVNSLHAADRRSREGKKPDPAPQPTAQPDDPLAILAIRDAFDDATAELKLTKGQRSLLREAVMTKRPSDVDGYVQDYVSRAGWLTAPQALAPAQPPPAAQPQVTQIQPSNPQPISDKGSPAPGGVLDWEREFADSPASMSPAAIERMNAKHGVEKARRMRIEAVLARHSNLRVTAK